MQHNHGCQLLCAAKPCKTGKVSTLPYHKMRPPSTPPKFMLYFAKTIQNQCQVAIRKFLTPPPPLALPNAPSHPDAAPRGVWQRGQLDLRSLSLIPSKNEAALQCPQERKMVICEDSILNHPMLEGIDHSHTPASAKKSSSWPLGKLFHQNIRRKT